MISIIVPVYNAERYLHKCIDSILNQTYNDIELLLINDGSTDLSGVICDEYAQNDNRIRVLHKENSGVSATRNIGLDNITGEYVTFIDADDWIEPSMLNDVYEKIKADDADIVFVDIKYCWPSESRVHFTYRWKGSPQEALIDYLKHTRLCPGWGLMRSSIIKNNNLRFPENLTIYEDFHLLIRYVYKSRFISQVEKPLYNYRMQNSSIVHTTSHARTIDDQVLAYNSILQFFKENGVYHKYAPSLYDRVLFDYQRMVLDPSMHDTFCLIYPEKKHYIWQASTINFKLKLMMWCLTHRLSWITFVIVKVRLFYNKHIRLNKVY